MLHGIFQEDDSFEHTFQILNTHKILCIVCTAYTKVTCGPHWAFNSRLGVAKNLGDTKSDNDEIGTAYYSA